MNAPQRVMATGIVAASTVAWALTAAGQAREWSQWRGPNRDGVSSETGLLKQWPPAGPPQIWRAGGAGTGYSSFSSSAGRLYTLGVRGDTEYVIALDEATGRKLWETASGRRFRNEQGDGPRSTPTVDDSRVYAFGGSGDLSCLDAATGARIWAVNVVQRLGGATPYWGYSESPLVIGDRLLVNVGGRRASIVAFNKQDGAVLWQNHDDEAGYSSPVLIRTGSLAQAF
jgi:outer membrane protein assembly factor BamB